MPPVDFQKAVEVNDHANTLFEAGLIDDAVEEYRRALAIYPELATPHYNLGNCMQAKAEWQAAVGHYQRALELAPRYAPAHNNLANTLHRLRQPGEALIHYQAALEIQPGYPEAWYGLGNLALETGQLNEACACYRQSLASKPGFARAHFNLALTLLLAGNYSEGWTEYEWRWQCADTIGLPKPHFAQPLWDGVDAHERTILVHAEQGFGDTLQFLRYLELLKPRVGRLVLQCQPELVRLLEQLPCVDQLVAEGSPLPEFDVHAPLLSLPLLLAVPRFTPPNGSYLTAASGGLPPWREQIASATGLKAGLVWAGRPLNAKDAERSMLLSDFAPLLRLPGVQWFALQKGDAARQLADIPSGATITDLDPYLGDFADTALALADLDLLVTVDTSVAHLAGALGRPVWLLLANVPNWRWGLDGETTPWYPTMRLFRQSTEGDWSTVIDNVAGQLSQQVPSPSLSHCDGRGTTG